MIRDRLAWDPARPVGRAALAYELLVLRRGGDDRRAARPHRRGATRRARPARGRLRSSCTSRTPSSSRRIGAAVSPPGCARCRSQTARRCAAAAGCASRRADRPGRGDGAAAIRDRAERMPRLRSYERAGFQKVDPDRRALRAAGLPAARGACRRAASADPARRWCSAVSGARDETDDAGGRARAPSSTRSTPSTACTSRPPRSIRCAARGQRLDGSPAELPLATTDGVITAYPSPGLCGADRQPRDADAEVPAGRRRARGPSRRARARRPRRCHADELRPRPHAGVRRRRAHGRAARARRVAEVPVVAGALAVGAADQRRRARGRRPRARRRRRRRARERLPSLARRSRRGLLHLQRAGGRGRGAARRRGGSRRVAVLDLDLHYGNGTASLCASRPWLFNCSIYGNDYWQNTAYRDVETVRHRDGANHVSFALPNGSGRATLLRGPRARHGGNPCVWAPGSGALPGRRRPLSRGSRTRRSTSITTICASATAWSSPGRSARRCRWPGCSRAATRRSLEGRGGAPWHLRRGRRDLRLAVEPR